MARLRNHPSRWLGDDAAAAFDRAEAAHGKFVVNSAGRTTAEQQGLINRWDRGGAANRPPYLYSPARPAGSSNHVRDGGLAIDIGDWRRFAAIAAQYGFSHPYPGGDPVHFEYVGGKAPKVSEAVKNTQRGMNSVGYLLVVDGINGPLTKAAVKSFQKANGLVVDGIYGPKTAAAVAAKVKPKPAPVKPVKKAKTADFGPVDVVQRALKTKYRLYAWFLAVDNIDGPQTIKAVKEFQRRAGLVVDGIAGPATRRALGV